EIKGVTSLSELGRSMAHWTIAVAFLFGLAATQTAAQEQAYSKEWMIDMITSGESGLCRPLSHTYRWRNVGWGSNLNRFLALWLNSIIRDSENYDFGLDVTPACFRNTKCPVASKRTGEEISGWKCFFQPMARLCVFESDEVRRPLQQIDVVIGPLRRPRSLFDVHLTASDACPRTRLYVLMIQDLGKFLMANYEESQRINVPQQSPRTQLHDETETAAALLGYVYSNMQPWFKEDTDAMLLQSDVYSVRSVRYVAIHVRRGDKLTLKEASRTEVEVYLQAAASILRNSTGSVDGPNSIGGVWVSSDDPSVLPEVKALASTHFPNVQDERVVSISFGAEGLAQYGNKDQLPTTSHLMTYELYVVLHAELRMMSYADVFVGTFSSNIGRLVYLLREINGLPRYSTHSVDKPTWYFGRRELAMNSSLDTGNRGTNIRVKTDGGAH
ncbi:unnamed protein product, partial [Ectocarpus sp. 8 AP-2014]